MMIGKEQTGDARRWLGLAGGLLLFAAILALPTASTMTPAGHGVAAVAALMAVWWITEAVPIAVTALLPIVLFPVLGVTPTGEVTLSYANHLIYLFLGGFLIAIAMEQCNLHRRIALATLRLVGFTPRRIILGFMVTTAFLSMWISNTAAAMLMVTIGLAVLRHVEPQPTATTGATGLGFGPALVLTIAYSATLGGVATLIGSPPNAIFAGVMEKSYGVTVSFVQWMVVGLPIAIVMLIITWFYLTRRVMPRKAVTVDGAGELIAAESRAMGPMSRAEKSVAAVFSLVALAWLLRGLADLPLLRQMQDSTIAISGAIALFVLPAGGRPRRGILDGASLMKVPWDIIILFGGGFALAQGFSDSQLTAYIAGRLEVLSDAPLLVVIASIALLVIFLTELTSNTATASLLVPVMGALAVALDVHPYGLMITAVIAASFAFMLPVATPPNAIAFGARVLTIPQMARAGYWLNLAGAVVLTAFVYLLIPLLLR
jgi:sodium-dependent dicarboxylate transporter 2/3/5